MSHHWPLFGLTVRTPRIELRLATDEELTTSVDRILTSRIHGPDDIPFTTQWALEDEDDLPRSFLQFHWRHRANWKPESWNWAAMAFIDGEPVGSQTMHADDFASLRTVHSGSWLLTEHQGQGLGTHMRAAMLTLAFDHLGAVEAHSSARVGNDASIGVSRRMGYEDNGQALLSFGGQVAEDRRLRLTRDRWEAHRPDIGVEVSGLDDCLHLFGLEA